MRRSLLFLPGNTPNIIVNGDALGADNVILDLEDAVAPDQKDAARILVRNAIRFLGFKGVELTVRINSLDTPYWQDDLREMVPLRPDLIMPTKVGSAEDVATLDAFMTQLEERCGLPAGTVKLIPLIETARGLENAFAVARGRSFFGRRRFDDRPAGAAHQRGHRNPVRPEPHGFGGARRGN